MTGTERESRPLLTGEEMRILEVYDRLEELQLEIALLKAQGVLSQGDWFSFVVKLYNKGLRISDEPMDVSEEELTTSRQELLKAKATYQVRNNVIKSVLIANPILKAVHGGKNATIAEQ